MKKSGIPIFLVLLVCSSCSAGPTGDELYSSGMDAFDRQFFEKASDLFNQSIVAYDRERDPAAARMALHMKKRASWMLIEMTHNATQAREMLADTLPFLPEAEREKYLQSGESIQIVSDGEVRYFIGIANNMAYRNLTLMQDISRNTNYSEFFDELYPVIDNDTPYSCPYGNPHTFQAYNLLSIPREYLPDSGMLAVWIPLPIELKSQTNISITHLDPGRFVVSRPITTGDHGQVYFEIPLAEMTGPFLNVSAEYRFTTYERRHDVDPELIRPYNTTTEEFRTYTRSQKNTRITPETAALAREIVGDETNPYLMAEMIYQYIITTYPYSLVPHTLLAASETPESTFMAETGHGDCGTQSMFFCALCRSLGIPARTAGGYQLVPGIAGPHFWAEFYLPEYGWIPVDVTIAESAYTAFDKSEEERNRFAAYFFGNMDPYRYTIQNDVDQPFFPDPGEEILFTMVHQAPLVVCNESLEDVELMGMGFRNITFSEIGS